MKLKIRYCLFSTNILGNENLSETMVFLTKSKLTEVLLTKLAELGVVLNRATQRDPEIFTLGILDSKYAFKLFLPQTAMLLKAKSQIQFSTSSKTRRAIAVHSCGNGDTIQYITRFSPKENRNDQIKIIISKASAINI